MTPSPRPTAGTGTAQTTPLRRKQLVGRCRRGQEPLESLALAGLHAERDRLLRGWLRMGLSHTEIAAHTHTSTYTIGRLIDRLSATSIRNRRVA